MTTFFSIELREAKPYYRSLSSPSKKQPLDRRKIGRTCRNKRQSEQDLIKGILGCKCLKTYEKYLGFQYNKKGLEEATMVEGEVVERRQGDSH